VATDPDRSIYVIANHFRKTLYAGTTENECSHRFDEHRDGETATQAEDKWDWDEHDIELVGCTSRLTAEMAVAFAHEIEDGEKDRFLNQALPKAYSLMQQGYVFLKTDAGK